MALTAARPGCTSDPMEIIRQDHGLGLLTMTSSTHPALPGMMEAKFNISKLLDIPINSVERFKERTGS